MDVDEINFNDDYWSNHIYLIQQSLVPQKSVGVSRPCSEEDFQEYRATINQKFQDVLQVLQQVLDEYRKTNISLNSSKANIFKNYLIILLGEHSQKNCWTTRESIIASKQITEILFKLYSCHNLSQLLEQDSENITWILTTLRPKLLKDTWKSFPATVTCYKWLLSLMGKSAIAQHLGDVITSTLIILDDFEVANQMLGLECLSEILKHCSTEKKFVEAGFAQMVLVNLKKFTYQKDSRYILLLYNCIEVILSSIELFNDSSNTFEWSERDNILEQLLDNMECEENLQLRQSYMIVMPKLLNSLGSIKWCKRVIRILEGYCERYEDLKTIENTLENTKIVLLKFQSRIPTHCETLYIIFLKLYLNLIDTQINKDTLEILEDCICLVCESTPFFMRSIMQDDQVRILMKNSFRRDFKNRLIEIGVIL